MDKKEINSIIEEIWNARLMKMAEKSAGDVIDAKPGTPSAAISRKIMATLQFARGSLSNVEENGSFEEFVYDFFKVKYKAPSVIAYWSYYLLNGLKKYARSDSSIEMFQMILTGELSEQIFHDQCEMINSLKIMVMKMDVLWSNRQDGSKKDMVENINCKKEMAKSYVLSRHVPTKVLFAGLRKFFPLKSEACLQRLEGALERKLQHVTRRRQARAGLIAYDAFFLRENLREKDSFLSILCDQHLKEIKELILRIDMIVAGKDKRDKGRLLLIDIRDALSEADPYITSTTMKRYVKSGLGPAANLEEVHWDIYTEYEHFLTILKASTLVKPTMLWDANAIPIGPTSKTSWQGDRLEAITMELAEQQLSELDQFPDGDTDQLSDAAKMRVNIQSGTSIRTFDSQNHFLTTVLKFNLPGSKENNASNALFKGFKEICTKTTNTTRKSPRTEGITVSRGFRLS
jgi:hypothetical protein